MRKSAYVRIMTVDYVNIGQEARMGLFDRLKKKDGIEDGFLLFDNYPFRPAVIQQLMYEQEVLEDKYRDGDQYFEVYKDAAEVSGEESINRLKPYIEQGNNFFKTLKIPYALADKVTKLYVGEELVKKIIGWGIEVHLPN